MLKKIFVILAIVGMILIGVLAFAIPSNPNEIIPTMTITGFDKPLWFCIIFGFGFIYLMILWSIYDKLKEKIA